MGIWWACDRAQYGRRSASSRPSGLGQRVGGQMAAEALPNRYAYAIEQRRACAGVLVQRRPAAS